MPEFKIEYEDLLSGDDIVMKQVGHLRSPKLSEMKPSGIGWETYNLYIFFLRAGKEQLNEAFNLGIQSEDDLFDKIVQNPTTRKIYQDAFSFFIRENVEFNVTHSVYVIYIEHEANGEKKQTVIGLIRPDNFEYVRSGILLLNYITADKTNVTTKHSSKEAEEAWAKAQEYLAQQKIEKKEDETMSIGNMLSKLCSVHPSINYLNVFDLTIFQFFDTFFQTCYMRSVSFTEAIVATNGSKNFKYADWMKPVQNH